MVARLQHVYYCKGCSRARQGLHCVTARVALCDCKGCTHSLEVPTCRSVHQSRVTKFSASKVDISLCLDQPLCELDVPSA